MKILILSFLLALTLGSQDEILCLKSGDVPVQIFDISPELFPASDQKALKIGIPADSAETLQRLLEDYLS